MIDAQSVLPLPISFWFVYSTFTVLASYLYRLCKNLIGLVHDKILRMNTFHHSFLFVALLLGSCAIFVESAIPPSDRQSAKQEKSPVSLDDVLGGTLSAGGFGGVWSGDDTLRVISGRNVWEFNVTSGNNRTVVQGSVFQERFGNQSLGLSFSADSEYILVEHSRRNLWRHSFLAKYDTYNLQTGEFSVIQPKGLELQPQEELQLVNWAPTGHSLTFIFGNNIFYKKSHGASDVSDQITTDGDGAVFNGISDWVYEEEMFGSPTANWFSTDSSSLAFVKFNDTEVELFSWPVYGEPGVRDTVYGVPNPPLRYPKAGTKNPVVSVNIVKLNNPSVTKEVVYPADQDKSLQYYIATLKWASPTHLIVESLNRHQNQSVWNYCDAQDATCREIYTQTQNNPVGWIDAHTPTVSRNGDMFLTLQPVAQNDGKSYTHIVKVATGVSGSTTVTAGVFNVDSILGWDEPNNKIYFAGSRLTSSVPPTADPSERHVYSVGDGSTNSLPNCMSCDLKTGSDEECRSHSFSFSQNYQFYQHSCRGPGVPEITTKRTSNNDVVRIWNNNTDLRDRLSMKLLPTTEDMEVDIEGGFKAKVRLYLPPNFDENAKYPLLIDVYAGPDSQRLTQEYKVDWGTYLSSSQGIIYGSIDGRGSGRQSAQQKFSVYRNLGSAEIEDQIAVTKHLVSTLSYIDANKTAIWGWSYGGYATAMTLGKDTESVFKCGIAVAPVTSWLYYDTIYTERYMGLPSDEDNWNGYNASSVMNHLDGIRNKQFLLIHGNADDNVHYQNSMMLARALEQADVMFSQLSYPDENHSIAGPGMRRHLYHSIERFLTRECFGVDETGGKSSGSIIRFNSFYSIIFVAISVILTAYKK